MGPIPLCIGVPFQRTRKYITRNRLLLQCPQFHHTCQQRPNIKGVSPLARSVQNTLLRLIKVPKPIHKLEPEPRAPKNSVTAIKEYFHPFRFRRTRARVVDEAKMMPRYAYGTADKRHSRSCTSDHTSGTELIGYMFWSTVKFEPLVGAREPSFLGDPRELRSIQSYTTARMFILSSCRPAGLKKFRWRG